MPHSLSGIGDIFHSDIFPYHGLAGESEPVSEIGEQQKQLHHDRTCRKQQVSEFGGNRSEPDIHRYKAHASYKEVRIDDEEPPQFLP